MTIVKGLDGIKDPGLRTSLHNLGKAIAHKKSKKERSGSGTSQKPFRLTRGGRQFGGHTEEEIQAARRLAMRMTGEREDDYAPALVPAQEPTPSAQPFQRMVQLSLPFVE